MSDAIWEVAQCPCTKLNQARRVQVEAWWYEKAKATRAVELKGELHCRGVLATVEMMAAGLKEKEPRRTWTVDITSVTATADRYCIQLWRWRHETIWRRRWWSWWTGRSPRRIRLLVELRTICLLIVSETKATPTTVTTAVSMTETTTMGRGKGVCI